MSTRSSITTKTIKAKKVSGRGKVAVGRTKTTPRVTKRAPARAATLPRPLPPPVSPTPLVTNTIKRHPLGHLLLEKLLREAGFRGHVSTNQAVLDRYSTDESIFSIKPQVVIQPLSQADVELVVQIVGQETKHFPSLSLTPRAAGTGLSGGSLTDSAVLDITRLNQISGVSTIEQKHLFHCGPGAMWRDVERMLKAHQLYLPPYPASKDICSIGGSIANNAAGPDSLRYGQCADWVESLEVVLRDGHTYNIRPLSYREFQTLIKNDTPHAQIAREVFSLIKQNEKEIKNAKPKTSKNTAGYPLWGVLPEGVANFEKGIGTFDLTKVIAGSQGTIGIIVGITMRAIPIPRNTTLIAIPIFALEDISKPILAVRKYNPLNVEVFDDLTFDLALNNPSFFKRRLPVADYYRVMLALYSTYHVRYRRRTPAFTILITLDEKTTSQTTLTGILQDLSTPKIKPRLIDNPIDAEMFWQVRRASYTLSKLQDPRRRPAAFLEDIIVPPENIAKFLTQVKKLLREYHVTATIHGHGADGHFHFYPLLDFTNPATPRLVERMAEKCFDLAIKLHGGLCGEHNDGIIRTPHLSKIFSAKMLKLFKETEAIFDPDDIFNPGKKVNPRFDIKTTMRNTNH